jgi:hypothetical protein
MLLLRVGHTMLTTGNQLKAARALMASSRITLADKAQIHVARSATWRRRARRKLSGADIAGRSGRWKVRAF